MAKNKRETVSDLLNSKGICVLLDPQGISL